MQNLGTINEAALSLSDLIKNELIQKISKGNLHLQSDLKTNLDLEYTNRDWDTDSGNLYHASLYIPDLNINYKGTNKIAIAHIKAYIASENTI